METVVQVEVQICGGEFLRVKKMLSRNDLFPKRHQGKFDQLEMLFTKGDADDGEA